jgi:hypothetical protein
VLGETWVNEVSGRTFGRRARVLFHHVQRVALSEQLDLEKSAAVSAIVRLQFHNRQHHEPAAVCCCELQQQRWLS